MRFVKKFNNINFDYFEFALKDGILVNKKDFRNFYSSFIVFVALVNALIFDVSLPFNFLLVAFSVLVYFGITFFYKYIVKKNILNYANAFEGFASGLITLTLVVYLFLYLYYYDINVSYISKINLMFTSILNLLNCTLLTNFYNSYITFMNEVFVNNFNDINFVAFSTKSAFLFVDSFNINLSSFVFFIMFLFTVFLSFGVLVSKNPVNSLLFLISTYVYSSIILVLFKLEFFGLLYIIIYVGAIAVLFLFVIMMLKFEKVPEYKLEKNGLFNFFYIVLFVGLSFVFFKFYNNNTLEIMKYSRHTNHIYYDFSLNKYFNIGHTFNDLEDLGLVFYTDYSYAFLMCGLILLISIVAPILLTFRVREGVKEQYHSEQLSRDKKYIISLRDIK